MNTMCRVGTILAIGLLLTTVSTVTGAAKYSGGTGEPNDPYQIATAADLTAVGNEPNDYDKHFILTADIDLDPNLPGRKVFDRAVIAPAVTGAWGLLDGTPFTGVFDGKGHTISHLTISGREHVGLFGLLGLTSQWPSKGEIKNLGVVDVRISSSGGCVGGLVGENYGSLTACCSTGTVRGDGYYVGGLVGSNGNYHRRGGDLRDCHSTGTVRGEAGVGGLVGASWGTVTRCYGTGVVSGTSDVGGLVGANGGSVTQCYSTGAVSGSGWSVGGLVGGNDFGTVTQCYSTGAVSGGSYVGGLVGSNGGPVTQCYSTGVVTGSSNVGGLVGYNSDGYGGKGEVTACFWDTQTSGRATSAGGTARTTAQMKTRSTFANATWDFVGETANGTDDIWWINEGKDYPHLSWETTTK
jgi:hypothetical protein